jgi:hypothetical protein
MVADLGDRRDLGWGGSQTSSQVEGWLLTALASVFDLVTNCAQGGGVPPFAGLWSGESEDAEIPAPGHAGRTLPWLLTRLLVPAFLKVIQAILCRDSNVAGCEPPITRAWIAAVARARFPHSPGPGAVLLATG